MGEHDTGKKIINPRKGITEASEAMPERFAKRNTGTFGEQAIEDRPRYFQKGNEKILEGPSDSQIVLGKDFKYGDFGHAKANSIDIVVGRGSCGITSLNEKAKQRQWIKETTRNDSARIYISQATNLDNLFEMPKDEQNKTPAICSGIGMKADTVRMISRNNIRIQSGCDTILSNELKNPEKVGIDLIAGVPFNGDENYNEEMCLIEGRDSMQSIPKGQNLEDALEYIVELLDSISGVLINYIKIQEKLNTEFAKHAHLETFVGNQGIASKDVIGPLLENKVSILEECTEDTFEFKVGHLGTFKRKFLNSDSPKYINSKYHRLN